MFDFNKVADRFKDFDCVGKKEWPVLYDEEKQLIMIHSPVGTRSLFDDGQCKIIISGFCTSLRACAAYLKDVEFDKKEGESEVKYTFEGLKTNLEKLLIGIGLYDKLNINDTVDTEKEQWKILEAIKANSKECPVLMTQALCCIGTEENSDADEIIKFIQDSNFPTDFRQWVDGSLTEWVDRITKKKSEDAILLLLGHRASGQKAAIVRLLKTARISNGVVSTNTTNGKTLYDYLSNEFNKRMGFLVHPAQLTDKNLNEYCNSNEGKKVKGLIKNIVMD
ncbi:hypothetical protein EAL2_c19620 [Peptoclostridium acidaminophilum DSM 3953]|uniref:Uncharacterized protein n=1 Tax=Peptoclostridium acidaminophilum DSM 3953 TaxID=1286171 RepID=W8THE5_PEPAC|nr:hypothetical protein [Peptoclostridium acidaminophilum]AHM57243.1 hypothetical protein EAL2_c19620 [Peptoclostridium acidaminophilum DSM 3953]